MSRQPPLFAHGSKTVGFSRQIRRETLAGNCFVAFRDDEWRIGSSGDDHFS
jgi:hypothetical protein